MKFFKDLFLTDEERRQTEVIVDVIIGTSDYYTLLSRRIKDGLEQYYLFNCVKVLEKNKKEFIDG